MVAGLNGRNERLVREFGEVVRVRGTSLPLHDCVAKDLVHSLIHGTRVKTVHGGK